MSGIVRRYLLDTNVLIYYFNGDVVVKPIFDEIAAGTAQGFYCPISWVEILCYPGLTKKERNQVRNILRSLTCVALTEAVLDRAAEIRRDYRTALPDALIAACSMESKATLVTRNVSDFRRIIGLSWLNPFDR